MLFNISHENASFGKKQGKFELKVSSGYYAHVRSTDRLATREATRIYHVYY